jgi:PQQ-dependent catabolism-associated CXXCW motif protein
MYDNEGQDFGVAPTTAIRTTGFEAPTPLTISGATTVSTAELRTMLASGRPPILIDVLGGDVTQSLPDAIWLRGAGLGNSLEDVTQKRLASELTQLTKGNKSAPIAFFCLSRTCWLSHNTAVRAVALGYTNVLWYRGGRNAWRAAGLPLQPVKPTDM